MGLRHSCLLLIVLTLLAGACGNAAAPGTSTPTTEGVALPAVELRGTTVTWETLDYELTRFNTIAVGSFDGVSTVPRTFDAWVLENEYLVVTLVPEFGGRILSMVYKPTGHEQLFQNPLGRPYQIDTGVFYYDWLMVYGGIFPTFPEPEHGKAWFLPWDFEVVEETEDSVTVAMTFTDDIEQPFAPPQYGREATGLELRFLLTLDAGRASLDATIEISNPGDEPVELEYWTSLALAPGSTPGASAAVPETEIVVDVDLIEIPPFWTGIAEVEEAAGVADVYEFDTLRVYGDWPDLGIAYAYPDAAAVPAWGAVNRSSGEGLFRVADNEATPGLKLWTWGDPRLAASQPPEAGPYVELWAGITRKFFESTELGAGERIVLEESYVPTVGLSGVTHAADEVLVHLVAERSGRITTDLFGVQPDIAMQVSFEVDGSEVHREAVALDPRTGNRIEVEVDLSVAESVTLVLTDDAGRVVLEGSAPVSGD